MQSLRFKKGEGRRWPHAAELPWQGKPFCFTTSFLICCYPTHLTREHQNICFMPESSGPLGDGESREPQAQASPLPSPVSSLLLALSTGILAPDPESFFKKKKKLNKISPPSPGTTSRSWPGSADNEQFGLKIQAQAKHLPKSH